VNALENLIVNVLYVGTFGGGFALLIILAVRNAFRELRTDRDQWKEIALERQEIIAGLNEQMAELEARSEIKRDTRHRWWHIPDRFHLLSAAEQNKPLSKSALIRHGKYRD
jgi:hypothetical protein